ncbi:unnamed protein product [Protopolystoma xenopodis]|uniref:Uncharacterized protein n=1 Tax=Protopolystoma xenopodis TaxID=117903 RepID=A0A3S5AN32_9PLAT|nr:unnamed protein product [Protopolystoma xenopodis]
MHASLASSPSGHGPNTAKLEREISQARQTIAFRRPFLQGFRLSRQRREPRDRIGPVAATLPGDAELPVPMRPAAEPVRFYEIASRKSPQF